MSTVDLDDIRERVESHYVGVPPWSAEQDARVLLGEVEGLRADLDLMYRVRDNLAVEVEGLRAVLREVLGEFTDKGSIGAIHNVLRSRWVNVGTVEGWRAASTGEDA